MAISDVACKGTQVLLDSKQLTVELARQIQRDLALLPEFPRVVDSLDRWERLSALDLVLYARKRGLLATLSDGDYTGPDFFKLLPYDWNIVLRRVNHWFDRVVAAFELPTREARKLAFARIETELGKIGNRVSHPISLTAGFVSLERRSKMVGDVISQLMVSSPSAAAVADERCSTILQLTRTAAAIATYRAELVRYPEKLDELAPKMLEELPVDLYNARPLHYRRLAAGYLLYSTGDNGADDRGSHIDWSIFEGQLLDDLTNLDPKGSPPQIPDGADDISIRLPRPLFVLPKDEQARDL